LSARRGGQRVRERLEDLRRLVGRRCGRRLRGDRAPVRPVGRLLGRRRDRGGLVQRAPERRRAARGGETQAAPLRPARGPALLVADRAAPEPRRCVELAGPRRLAIQLPRARRPARELAPEIVEPVESLRLHSPALTPTLRIITSGDSPWTGTT